MAGRGHGGYDKRAGRATRRVRGARTELGQGPRPGGIAKMGRGGGRVTGV